MKALRIHAPGGLAALSYDDIARPQPAAGEVLVQVYASGVSPQELTWSTSTGELRPLPATLGFELSGVVAELGADVKGFSVGEAVYGMPSFKMGGSQAEYITVLATELAAKPFRLTHVEASAVPLSALTAWQALFEQAHLLPDQTVLIQGAAGGVGLFAVQLAHWAGAKVIATASGRNRVLLAGLGADEVIDYTTTRFEDVVQQVDVVLDTIGGDTLARSWSVLKKAGILVSVANVTNADLQLKAAEWGVRATWFLVHPSQEQLNQLSELLDKGQVKPQIEAVLPLSQGLKAYEEGLKGHNRGKLVLQIL